MNTFRVTKVRIEDVPQNKRMILGKYRRLFEEMLDLKPSMSVCIEMDKRSGYNATNELRKMAKAEGMILGWSRNLDHSAFYYWLERPKPAQVRRTA